MVNAKFEVRIGLYNLRGSALVDLAPEGNGHVDIAGAAPSRCLLFLRQGDEFDVPLQDCHLICPT